MNTEEDIIQSTYEHFDLQADKVSSPFMEIRKITENDECLISDVRTLLEQRVSHAHTVIVLRHALASISLTILKRVSAK